MFQFKCVCILAAVFLMAGCSYFDTGETIEVTSENLAAPAQVVNEHSFSQLVYNNTDGAVRVFDLDKTPEDALNSFEPLDMPVDNRPRGLNMRPSVEIYPIDIPMQKTLKP